MSKFANRAPVVRTPVQTTQGRILTATGGVGFEHDAKSELFMLAVSNMVSEDSFHERAIERDARFVAMVRHVTGTDPEWVREFGPILRNVFNMRSASLVLAAEYVAAGGKGGRSLVSSVLQRPDEPGELLAYWHQMYGRAEPQPIKRGVADALQRLYNERSVVRWDGTGNRWRFADVIERVHPVGAGQWQSDLFKYLLDNRHHGVTEVPASLKRLAADRALLATPEDQRRAIIGGDIWNEAGWSWERISGWLPGGMDAAAWEAAIPQMGYMALLRNLRNFEEARISDDAADAVSARLMDPAEVARSRQFPFRFLSAFREVPSMRYAYALERALELSLINVPSLPGRTLVLIDMSGSMWAGVSGRSKRQPWELAMIFGGAVAKRAERAMVIGYGQTWRVLDAHKPLLRMLSEDGQPMGGTYTFQTLAATYENHDRVIIVTDEQAHDAGHYDLSAIPKLYTFNIGGYRAAHSAQGQDGHYAFAGLTDACFRIMSMLEMRRGLDWDKFFAEVAATS